MFQLSSFAETLPHDKDIMLPRIAMVTLLLQRSPMAGNTVLAVALASTIALLLCVLYCGVAFDSTFGSEYSDYKLLNYEFPRRRLQFVHIARNGGTAIAREAYRNDVHWGVCNFEETSDCSFARNRWTPTTQRFHQCPWQHVPSQYFDNLLSVRHNPYHDADRFVVVRNVYDRLISEFYYSNRYNFKSSQPTVTQFNAWFQETLATLSNLKRGDMSRAEPGNQEYFSRFGRLIPQYDYVYENGEQVVQHVLRYETLHHDFAKLMFHYDLHLRLPSPPPRSDGERLSVYNLTKTNLLGIESIYANDFREWGYDIMSKRLSDEDLARTQKAMAVEETSATITTATSSLKQASHLRSRLL